MTLSQGELTFGLKLQNPRTQENSELRRAVILHDTLIKNNSR